MGGLPAPFGKQVPAPDLGPDDRSSRVVPARPDPESISSVTEFAALGLAAPLLKALATAGYTAPTPIQSQSIPPILKGHDLQGIAQTGTGKTAAFALPILHRFLESPAPRRRGMCRALILSPTRELAVQIGANLRAYAKNTQLRVGVWVGGVGKGPQARSILDGLDILVSTPGRLLDHLNDRTIRLDGVEVFVLDEADHMLDLGFIIPIRRIAALLPASRQTLFFSATMPPAIAKLASSLLRDPISVAVTPVASTVPKIEQKVVFVETSRKRAMLEHVLGGAEGGLTLVFCRTKHGADRVVQHLEGAGYRAAAIHGNKSQGQRQRALQDFRDGRVRILVATDLAARGIDVDGITHVVNYDLPNVAESYVHRIGRTGRAGATGTAISFCDAAERSHLRDIEKLIRAKVPVLELAA
jgi:ATP-dependent RNA helicase RhlE